MKRFVLITAFALTTLMAEAQTMRRFTFAATIGTGISVTSPSYVPFALQAIGYYNISERFSLGIGTGLSIYEEALIPVLADVKFTIIKPKRFTPYIGCGAGYGFALSKSAKGGFYLNPHVGVQYSVCCHRKLFFSLGYESQSFKRLKQHEHPLFNSEFTEHLNHGSVSLKIGYMF